MNKCMPYVETSTCCRAVGGIGLSCASSNRKPLMTCGAIINTLSLVLTLMGSLALSDSASMTKSWSWVQATGHVREVELKSYAGVSAKVDIIDCSGAKDPAACTANLVGQDFVEQGKHKFERVMSFDSHECGGGDKIKAVFSQLSPEQQASWKQLKDQCEKCKDKAITESTLILSMVTVLPSIATNLQRATKFGDINCQAFVGSVTATFSFLSSMMSMVKYAQACRKEMPESIAVGVDEIKMTWKMGPGFLCVLLGTVIKVIDILIHCLVPTPPGRWKKIEPYPANVMEYLHLFDGPAKAGSNEEATTVGALKLPPSIELASSRESPCS